MSEDKETDDIPSDTEIIAPTIKNLSPTKIADQFWCEMQLHFKLEFGMEPTEVMITGSKIHQSLEEELGPIIEVEVTTLEDSIITYILQIYTKLQMLVQKGITRELPVFGRLYDIPILGIVDQLTIEEINGEKKLIITDYKTRKSKRAPSYEQKRRNRIQMQVYWYMLHNLIIGTLSEEMFKQYFEITKKLNPSEVLLEQLPEELKELLNQYEPLDLLHECFTIFKNLPPLSEELNAVYLYQEDQTVVHSDRTFFHETSFDVDMDWAMGYWTGKRKPNDCPQQWMCKFCQFTDKCSYFLKRYLKDDKKKRKK